MNAEEESPSANHDNPIPPVDLSGEKIASAIAAYIDHTLLDFGTGERDVLRLCREAVQYGFHAVCVPPAFVTFAQSELAQSSVLVATVVSFPFGEDTTKVKVYSASDAMINGAKELDVVANLGALLNGDYAFVCKELSLIVSEVTPVPVKVIIETPLLEESQIISSAQAVLDSGADMVKTSTGFSGTATNISEVKLLHSLLKGRLGIKASGGIRSFESAKAMLSAGAIRLGTSSGLVIVKEARYALASS